MEPKNIKLSVALAVYNEESNIADCLESIKGIASEIIVVDGESSDRTAQIAKHLGATVISTPNLSNFHINKQKAIDACTGDWILQLDADERVSSMLAKEIKKIIETDLSGGRLLPQTPQLLPGPLDEQRWDVSRPRNSPFPQRQSQVAPS